MNPKITNWRMWLRGLIGALIGGAANGITAMVLDPNTFNFSTGLLALGKFAFVSGIISAALWLKTHPVPDEVQ